MSPQPWARTGPGTAKDGKPRFDLDRFDEAFFDRLRERVIAAGERGIYVAVMLFDGWALHLSPAPDHVEGHPFHAANNVNGVGIDSIVDYQVLPLDPRVQAIQEAYIRKVVDTLHDLPNVLWEVANESSGGGDGRSRVRGGAGPAEHARVGRLDRVAVLGDRHRQAVREREGYDAHPDRHDDAVPGGRPDAGSTSRSSAAAAEWISPGYDDEIFADGGHPWRRVAASRWFADPPAADGTKVVITDTDHYAPAAATRCGPGSRSSAATTRS